MTEKYLSERKEHYCYVWEKMNIHIVPKKRKLKTPYLTTRPRTCPPFEEGASYVNLPKMNQSSMFYRSSGWILRFTVDYHQIVWRSGLSTWSLSPIQSTVAIQCKYPTVKSKRCFPVLRVNVASRTIYSERPILLKECNTSIFEAVAEEHIFFAHFAPDTGSFAKSF